MLRYVHGSEDSSDLDVVYLTQQPLTEGEARRFCDADPRENRNVAVVSGGIVTWCLKGHEDEVNNALLATCCLHQQAQPLLIQRPVQRDVFLKDIVVTRKILSALTRSPLRPQIKAAMRGSWQERLEELSHLNLAQLPYEQVPGTSRRELLKTYAFQLGQALGLHEGRELYTKSAVASFRPTLSPYLYRQEQADVRPLQQALEEYAAIVSAIPTEQLTEDTLRLPDSGAVYDFRRERCLRK